VERKEFLSLIGLGAAAVACTYCLGGCKVNDPGITGPSNVDFTLDLSAPNNGALKSAGGYVYNSGVIVANTGNEYIAVSSTCTHQGSTVVYDPSSKGFYCPAHGSRFAQNGSVTQGPAGSPLTRYNTTLNGTSLRVYS
jgi:cytochrome b6-f complex iron-sulfur subunit